MSWWNKKKNTEAIKSITPTLGRKLTDAYKKKLKMRRRGKNGK